ncbi:hypothetical protein [Streptomyces goshikiensis]|uniref:hypothetical protein n=1 Tax=Streptomyces goshikiensis TaxID=1942 RepID=UPI00369A0D4F
MPAAVHAAIVTADTSRQQAAEDALAACLTDERQLSQLTDSGGLCHGTAGLFQTVWRAAQGARAPALGAAACRLAGTLTGQHAVEGTAFLEGAAGQGLAQATALYDRAPASQISCAPCRARMGFQNLTAQPCL